MAGNWERRWHPLLEQWVLISARSASRPWSGAIANKLVSHAPEFDPECYLCPRVMRANGVQNPGKSLMQDLRTQTHTQQKLVVEAGHYFSVLVPFAARFAYETWIVPHRHVSSLAQMNTSEVEELAAEQLKTIDPDRWQP